MLHSEMILKYYSIVLYSFFSSTETDHWHGQSVTRESFPGGSVSGGKPSHHRHRQTHGTGLENPGVSTEGTMLLNSRVYRTSITGLLIFMPFWSLLSFCAVIYKLFLKEILDFHKCLKYDQIAHNIWKPCRITFERIFLGWELWGGGGLWDTNHHDKLNIFYV